MKETSGKTSGDGIGMMIGYGAAALTMTTAMSVIDGFHTLAAIAFGCAVTSAVSVANSIASQSGLKESGKGYAKHPYDEAKEKAVIKIAGNCEQSSTQKVEAALLSNLSERVLDLSGHVFKASVGIEVREMPYIESLLKDVFSFTMDIAVINEVEIINHKGDEDGN